MYLGLESYLNLITKRFMSLCTKAWGQGHSSKECKNKHGCRREFTSTAKFHGLEEFAVSLADWLVRLSCVIIFMKLQV
jgi:hypothetical protein